jgi:hypothetical protein
MSGPWATAIVERCYVGRSLRYREYAGAARDWTRNQQHREDFVPAYRGYLVDKRGKVIVGRDVDVPDDFSAITAVRHWVAADGSAHTYEVWRDLELIHAAMAPCAQFLDAPASHGVTAGAKAPRASALSPNPDKRIAKAEAFAGPRAEPWPSFATPGRPRS